MERDYENKRKEKYEIEKERELDRKRAEIEE